MCMGDGVQVVTVVTSLQLSKCGLSHITVVSYFPYHIKSDDPSETKNQAFSLTLSNIPNKYHSRIYFQLLKIGLFISIGLRNTQKSTGR
jgi:hypothetical protein